MKSMRFPIAAAAILWITSLPVFAEAGWTTNYEKAMEQATTENKAVLLDFTGSDWCEWCMKMKQETLDKPAFKDYAKQNLVCVTLDFPNSVPQSPQVKKQNAELQKKYKVSGFPTFILLSKDGKVLWSQPGYLAGGPTAFLGAVGRVYHPAPVAAAAATDDFDAAFKKK